MKYLKILALAAVAAGALMALAGAGTASATVLCTTTVTPCEVSWTYASNMQIGASLNSEAKATFRDTNGNLLDECTESPLGLFIEKTGSGTSTVVGLTTRLYFGGCTHTLDQITNGRLEFHHITGTDNGTAIASGITWTLETTITPEFIRSCVYGTGAGAHFGTLTGGSTATLDVHAVLSKVEGTFLCPGTIVLNATYEFEAPPMYVEPE